MKKTIIICCVILAISCRKIYDTPMPQASIPDKMGSANVSPIPSTGAVTMAFKLEPSAKYNVTIQGMDGKIYKSYGISSLDGTLIKQENLTDLQSGSYDLILMNINGTESRSPIIIKK